MIFSAINGTLKTDDFFLNVALEFPMFKGPKYVTLSLGMYSKNE